MTLASTIGLRIASPRTRPLTLRYMQDMQGVPDLLKLPTTIKPILAARRSVLPGFILHKQICMHLARRVEPEHICYILHHITNFFWL